MKRKEDLGTIHRSPDLLVPSVPVLLLRKVPRVMPEFRTRCVAIQSPSDINDLGTEDTGLKGDLRPLGACFDAY